VSAVICVDISDGLEYRSAALPASCRVSTIWAIWEAMPLASCPRWEALLGLRGEYLSDAHE
jgi:hypothetical protein